VHGGEESGALPTVLQHLADYLDARQAAETETGPCAALPDLVTIVAIMIVTGIAGLCGATGGASVSAVAAEPAVADTVADCPERLSACDLAVSGRHHRGRVCGRAALHCAAMQQDAGWHRLLLRMPGLSPMIRGINTSRFASTLAILVGGGVPAAFRACFRCARDDQYGVAESVEHAYRAGARRRKFGRALGESKSFPPLADPPDRKPVRVSGSSSRCWKCCPPGDSGTGAATDGIPHAA